MRTYKRHVGSQIPFHIAVFRHAPFQFVSPRFIWGLSHKPFHFLAVGRGQPSVGYLPVTARPHLRCSLQADAIRPPRTAAPGSWPMRFSVHAMPLTRSEVSASQIRRRGEAWGHSLDRDRSSVTALDTGIRFPAPAIDPGSAGRRCNRATRRSTAVETSASAPTDRSALPGRRG